MDELGRSRICLLVVLLAGGILALAWWDWIYPYQTISWWNGETIYRFYVRRLEWGLVLSESICLGLWFLSTRTGPDKRTGMIQATCPFLLTFLLLFSLARYSFHPLGVQPGSSVWAYGLVTVTAATLAFPLYRLLHTSGAALVRRWGWLVVCLFALLYALVFGSLSVARHNSFRTHALDLGTMDQAAWNTIHGRILERTPLYRPPAEGGRHENRFLDAKLELIFIPLSVLYWIWPDPRMLLIVQTLFLAAGAIPLYLLVRKQGAAQEGMPGSIRAEAEFPAVVLAISYLLYLPLHYVNMADFHPSALMVPLFIGVWRAMTIGRWRWYYVCLLLVLCCRIEAAFITLAMGGIIAIRNGIARRGTAGQGSSASLKQWRRHGLYTACIAAAWLVINFAVVVPLVRQAYGPGTGNLIVRRFGALGHDTLSIVQTVVTQPGLVVTRFADREKLQTAFDLLSPIGFFPLLNPVSILPAVPILIINLLAGSSWQNSIQAHYMAPVLPFLWIATAGVLAYLSKRQHGAEKAAIAATFILLNTLFVSILFSPFPPGQSFHLADFYQPSSYQENLRSVIALVPKEASVCAQSDIHPHVSQRRDASLFPGCDLEGQEKAEYVILDLDMTSNKSPLGYHPFYELMDIWLTRPEYGVIAQQGGAVLLKRGAPQDHLPEVLSNLDRYGRDFYRVRFMQTRTPPVLSAQEIYRIPIVLRNTGSQCWHSLGQLPVRLSYRWWTSHEALLAVDAPRTELPHRVEPGQEVRLSAWLLTPTQPGQYTLEWDLLREGDAWFGDMGGAMLRQQVTIR